MNEFIRRLKQRKLVQWALAYVAFWFALLQGIDIVATRFNWPDAIERYFILALAIGFFVTLVLAWYHGERGAQRVGGSELLIIALLLAIGGVLIWRFGQAVNPTVVKSVAAITPAKTGTPESIDEQSIAVLPLVNESADKNQQYFSDGLSEDFITALSQFDGLKVIGRDSAFQFRDTKDDAKTIGTKLGVAHLLEGSVQRAGDEVRISAELINTADGSTLWSQRYDRPYKDLFKLQDDITTAVAGALKTKLLIGKDAVVQSDRPPSGNLDAYNAYQQGMFYAQRPSAANLHRAIEFFDQAIHLDSRYAMAYAMQSGAWIQLAVSFLESPREQHQAFAKADEAVHTALTLNPNLAAAHSERGRLLATTHFDWRGAEAEYRRALQLAPESGQHQMGTLLAALGQPQQALDQLQQALAINPLCARCYSSQAIVLMGQGRADAAVQAIRKALELAPTFYWNYIPLTYLEVQRGHTQAAMQVARQIPPGPWHNVAVAMAQQAGGDHIAADAALKTLIDTSAGTAAYQVAEIYALRKQPDPMFAWLERARINRDPAIEILLNDPPILRYKGDPRFAAFCRKVGLPVPGSAPAPAIASATTQTL